MSDSTAPSEGNTDVSGENTDGFKPVTSQEDLDRIIENRLVRERKKFADPVSRVIRHNVWHLGSWFV